MMKYILLLAMLLTQWAFARSQVSVLSQKLKPLTWEAEKILSANIEQSIAPMMGSDKFSVKVSLEVSATKLAQRLGLNVTKTQSSLELPGLDEVANFTDERAISYEPKINDVLTSITGFEVAVNSNQAVSPELQAQIQEVIKAEVKTLGVNDVNVSFLESKIPQKATTEPTKIEVSKSELPENLPYIIAGSVVFAGIIMALMMYFVVSIGMKKMETMSQSFGKNLSEAISNVSYPTSSPIAPSKSEKLMSSEAQNTPSKTETYEELMTKIHDFFKAHYMSMNEIFSYITNLGDVEVLFVALEALPEGERKMWKEKIPDSLQVHWREFLGNLSKNDHNLSSSLFSKASSLYRDLRLFTHDPELLKKQALKAKVQRLDRLSIAQLVEHSDEREFGFLVQLVDPIQLSSVLSSYPHLLKKFNKIPTIKLSAQDMSMMQKRIDDQLGKQKDSIQEEVSISSFLPPELEKEFNAKTGVTQSSWEKLSPDHKKGLVPFALSLPIDQLGSFLAILPENLKSEVLNNLPDLKSQQVQRRGIHMNEESFRLKNAFLVQNRTSSLNQ